MITTAYSQFVYLPQSFRLNFRSEKNEAVNFILLLLLQ